MDRNEAKFFITNNSSKIREKLEQIKKITNPETRKREAKLAYNYHWINLRQVVPYYESYELWKEGIDLSEYDSKVRELRNLSHEVKSSQGQNQTNRLSHCSQCNKKSIVYHYIWDKRIKKLEKSYSNATDLNNEWVFCNQSCFDEWYKKWWSSFGDELKNFTCKSCKKGFQVEREYKKGKEITKNYDCCSQQCLNSWNQNNSKEQNKKKCSGSDCSNLLTSEETCYCASCSKKQEQIWKNLEKNQQDINKDLDNFNKGLNDYVENQKSNADESDKNNNPIVSRERERQQSYSASTITTHSNHSVRTNSN